MAEPKVEQGTERRHLRSSYGSLRQATAETDTWRYAAPDLKEGILWPVTEHANRVFPVLAQSEADRVDRLATRARARHRLNHCGAAESLRCKTSKMPHSYS